MRTMENNSCDMKTVYECIVLQHPDIFGIWIASCNFKSYISVNVGYRKSIFNTLILSLKIVNIILKADGRTCDFLGDDVSSYFYSLNCF